MLAQGHKGNMEHIMDKAMQARISGKLDEIYMLNLMDKANGTKPHLYNIYIDQYYDWKPIVP